MNLNFILKLCKIIAFILITLINSKALLIILFLLVLYSIYNTLFED